MYQYNLNWERIERKNAILSLRNEEVRPYFYLFYLQIKIFGSSDILQF